MEGAALMLGKFFSFFYESIIYFSSVLGGGEFEFFWLEVLGL